MTKFLHRPVWATEEKFCEEIRAELEKAVTKFPCPNPTVAALAEEVGEASQAVLHVREGKRSGDEAFRHLWEECVQVATMALRLAIEADHTLGVKIYQGVHD